jgi:hypothetical protein
MEIFNCSIIPSNNCLISELILALTKPSNILAFSSVPEISADPQVLVDLSSFLSIMVGGKILAYRKPGAKNSSQEVALVLCAWFKSLVHEGSNTTNSNKDGQ